jgi:hypothetical protein
MLGCSGEDLVDNDKDGVADGIREPDTISVVAPSTPKGTVSGQVLTTRLTPLSEVTVAMTIGSATAGTPIQANTDAEGNFMFKDVPAGSQVLLTVTKAGYSTLRAVTAVPSSAGNIPINNGNASVGPITLTELNSTVRFTLIAPSGRPAVGARVVIEALPAGTIGSGSTSTQVVSTLVLQGTADDQGTVTFSNVPSPVELARIGGTGANAGGYRIWVDPIDLNGDGIYDAGGLATKYDASTLITYGNVQIINLPDPRNGTPTSFNIRTTNVSSLNGSSDPLRNMVRPGESIYVTFSHPVQKDSVLAILTDEYGKEALPVTVSTSATGDTVTIVPPAAAIRDGQEYNIILRTTSAYDGTTSSWTGYFIGGDTRTPRQLQMVSFGFKDTEVNGLLDAGECVVITFNQVLKPAPFQNAEAFFKATTNSLNVNIGDDPGEYGNRDGFQLSSAAPPVVGGCLNDVTSFADVYPIDTGYGDTPRYLFIYNGSADINPALNVEVKVDFGDFRSTDPLYYYETAWGAAVPASTVLQGTLTRL